MVLSCLKSLFLGFENQSCNIFEFFVWLQFFFIFLLNYKYGKNSFKPKKIQTFGGFALSAGRYSIFGAITVKNWKNWKSWEFWLWGTYLGPLQTLFIIRTKFWYKQCDKLAKVPSRVKLGGFSWNLENQLYRLRFVVQKIFLYASLNVPRGVFHRGVKPPNSEKVYIKSVVALWLPHLIINMLVIEAC